MDSFIKSVLCLLIILLIWDNQGWFVYYLITCLSVDNMVHYGCFIDIPDVWSSGISMVKVKG